LDRIDVSEANAKIPRKVTYDGASTKLPWVLIFALMIAPVACAWGAYGDIRDSNLHDILLLEGHATNGEVTERHAIHRGGVDVRYRFSVDGVSYSGRAEIPSHYYRASAPGTQIPIRYLPNDPRVNQPSNWEWDWGHIVYYLLGLVTLGGVGIVIIVALRARKLARMGVVVEGRVTGCAFSRNGQNTGRAWFTVYYEFTTQDNVWMEGSTEMPEECEAGDSIPVMYLPRNPKRNDRYLRGFSVVE
jgi:hypothetical protein